MATTFVGILMVALAIMIGLFALFVLIQWIKAIITYVKLQWHYYWKKNPEYRKISDIFFEEGFTLQRLAPYDQLEFVKDGIVVYLFWSRYSGTRNWYITIRVYEYGNDNRWQDVMQPVDDAIVKVVASPDWNIEREVRWNLGGFYAATLTDLLKEMRG